MAKHIVFCFLAHPFLFFVCPPPFFTKNNLTFRSMRTIMEMQTNGELHTFQNGGELMIRVNRKELTRSEIIRVASNCFLLDGYTKTTVSAMCKKLNMSPGNLTFHFPTKEHLLAELTDMLGRFQWKLMEEEAKDGYSSVMAICLELLTMASACGQDEIAKDFFLSTYRSELCMNIIRKNDKERAKLVFGTYCPHWTDEKFEEAETLVSGIEYATLLTTEHSASLEMRIRGALYTILGIYNVPEELRKQKIEKVLAMDYKSLGIRVLEEFRNFVDTQTEQALLNLLKRKETVQADI